MERGDVNPAGRRVGHRDGDRCVSKTRACAQRVTPLSYHAFRPFSAKKYHSTPIFDHSEDMAGFPVGYWAS